MYVLHDSAATRSRSQQSFNNQPRGPDLLQEMGSGYSILSTMYHVSYTIDHILYTIYFMKPLGVLDLTQPSAPGQALDAPASTGSPEAKPLGFPLKRSFKGDIGPYRAIWGYIRGHIRPCRFKVWAPNLGPYLSLPCLGGLSSMVPYSEMACSGYTSLS